MQHAGPISSPETENTLAPLAALGHFRFSAKDIADFSGTLNLSAARIELIHSPFRRVFLDVHLILNEDFNIENDKMRI